MQMGLLSPYLPPSHQAAQMKASATTWSLLSQGFTSVVGWKDTWQAWTPGQDWLQGHQLYGQGLAEIPLE